MINASDLARHYSRFRVSERLLLTGHSHQAGPDAGFEAQQQAWLDAAEHLDHKWGLAEEQAERVRDGWRRLLGEPRAEIPLGQNTHELVCRFLSALPLDRRPRLVTTDGEFHTIRRQLDRLSEAGLDVRKVPSRPVETLVERMAADVNDRTAAVLVSSVLFETAEIVPGLGELAAACVSRGAELLVDAYHHLNVVPFQVEALGLQHAFVVGGGYKYCQLGEGNCFLRVPPDCQMRPVFTGWFAEFAALEETARDGAVAYGRGAARFAGATYDPSSHYRAASVFAFAQKQGLTADALRALSRAQTTMLADAVEALDIAPARVRVEPIAAERRAGFVALRAADAPKLARTLAARGVWCDARGERLRLGPAPYVTNEQLLRSVEILGDVLREA
ncbi:MAG: kynureninase [Acidobacteria bacterium]|nr:kynureninase [Acidobacteriota bacterium]